MNFNFELILFYAVLVTGFIVLLDMIYFAPQRKKIVLRESDAKLPLLIEYSRSFFPILIIVFLIRSFLYEPFRIPSGSLEPTLLTGDFILVNKFDYGVRLPVVHQKLFGDELPKRGDIMVFRWPVNPSIDFIKRVVGVPGDRINYVNKELYINGQKVERTFKQRALSRDGEGNPHEVTIETENLDGVKHNVYIDADKAALDYADVVPPHMYFMMGDNRDDSADSRYWGFVPEANIVGKAVIVWMSWDQYDHSIRWKRIGKTIA